MARQLGALEKAVMDRLWSWGHPVAVREVLEDLRRERVLAYTTVMTVMDNLHRKGMLTRHKVGRAFQYRPALTREEYTAAAMEEALAGTANTASTLLHFVERIPAEDVALLRAALDGRLHDDNDGRPAGATR